MISLRTSRSKVTTTTAFLLAAFMASSSHAFVVVMRPTAAHASSSPSFHLSMAAAATENDLPSIDTMRAGAIKKELESYGISTVSFLEKSELVNALTKARADGLKPKASTTTKSTSSSSSSSNASSSTASSSSASSSSSSSSSSDDSRPREERIKEELANCMSMKAGELKKELEERGVSTKSFFEKSEFAKALAEARVDGVTTSNQGGDDAGGEGYAEYSNVEVLTDDASGPRPKADQQQQSSSSSNPFGGAAGGNPFGGGGAGGSPFGGGTGMGGMGGIADMLKNMGMGGGGGAAPGGNPFGGAGGNPFGGAAGGANPFGGAGGANPFGGMGGMDPNMMAKAQQMMSNPKVQQILAKAQSNPSIMAKVNECMSNPASFAKYQNDPDVAELIAELRKNM